VIKGGLDEILQGRTKAVPLSHRLRHEHDEHILLRINPESRASCAADVFSFLLTFPLNEVEQRAAGGFNPSPIRVVKWDPREN
jgi:hypothetical protein